MSEQIVAVFAQQGTMVPAVKLTHA